MLLTFDDIYVIMAFMIKRQENKRTKNTLKKNQNYSRMPLTIDDNYIIMANMTNNNTNVFSERFTMNNRTINRISSIVNIFAGTVMTVLCGICLTFPIWMLFI